MLLEEEKQSLLWFKLEPWLEFVRLSVSEYVDLGRWDASRIDLAR